MSRVALLLVLAMVALAAIVASSTYHHPVAHLSADDYAEYCQLAFEQYHGPLRDEAKAASNGAHGVNFSTLHAKKVQKCLVEEGLVFAVPRAYKFKGNPDENVVANVENAHAAGFDQVDVSFFPCPTCMKTPTRQVEEFVEATANLKYGLVWFNIEAQQRWFPDRVKNQQFAEEMVAAFQAQGLAIGLYTNYVQWNEIFGEDYMGLPGFPTWVPRYRIVPNPVCNDLFPFGTYKQFSMKQFQANEEFCDGLVDFNSYCHD